MMDIASKPMVEIHDVSEVADRFFYSVKKEKLLSTVPWTNLFLRHAVRCDHRPHFRVMSDAPPTTGHCPFVDKKK